MDHDTAPSHHHHSHDDHSPREDASWNTAPGRRAVALRECLIEAGIFTRAELARMVDRTASRSPADGARVVAKAWSDPAFREALLAEPNAALSGLGIDMGPTRLHVVENTERLHNMIVCTLCSCYPRALLGIPPDWYKSRAYRSRAVREPRTVLAEFGLDLSPDVEVRVHDSTADLRYLVLPARPAGSDGMDEAALAGLVTRDCMVGTAVPRR